VASGQASNQWIAEARRLALALPGVTGFSGKDLISAELNAAKNLVEGRGLRFDSGTTQLAAGQERALPQLISDIQKLVALADASGKTARIEIIGHSSAEGTENTNLRLSQERAEMILSMLGAKGINPAGLGAVGVGSNQPVSVETTPDDKKFNRSVSFKVTLTDPPQRKASSP
jgi:outer membrane protein OmpA-like peptidoglycan-associated protein